MAKRKHTPEQIIGKLREAVRGSGPRRFRRPATCPFAWPPAGVFAALVWGSIDGVNRIRGRGAVAAAS